MLLLLSCGGRVTSLLLLPQAGHKLIIHLTASITALRGHIRVVTLGVYGGRSSVRCPVGSCTRLNTTTQGPAVIVVVIGPLHATSSGGGGSTGTDGGLVLTGLGNNGGVGHIVLA